MKKTEWYPVSINPVRWGRYEVRGSATFWKLSTRVFFRGKWYQLDRKNETRFGSHQRDKWRGLTQITSP